MTNLEGLIFFELNENSTPVWREKCCNRESILILEELMVIFLFIRVEWDCPEEGSEQMTMQMKVNKVLNRGVFINCFLLAAFAMDINVGTFFCIAGIQRGADHIQDIIQGFIVELRRDAAVAQLFLIRPDAYMK